ncbi:Uncharacterised protein [Mycobacteroides abscessus subsp. abscessus]|nr:Uncharacterised protein [Mycobacteroides abscessus subsp. abscessus]
MVTSFSTRSGLRIARLTPTTPPIELPIIGAVAIPSASMNASTDLPAVRTGMPSQGSLTPKPGNSRTKQWCVSAKTPRLPR